MLKLLWTPALGEGVLNLIRKATKIIFEFDDDTGQLNMLVLQKITLFLLNFGGGSIKQITKSKSLMKNSGFFKKITVTTYCTEKNGLRNEQTRLECQVYSQHNCFGRASIRKKVRASAY